ncbi:MAG: nickel transporter permease [Anaerovoracaceae bacterium]
MVDFLKKNRQLSLFLLLAAGVVAVAVFAPYIAVKDPLEVIMQDSLRAPDDTYLLGADKMGRDLFSRIIYGTRYSLVMAFSVVGIVFAVGTVLGMIAGYFGGIADSIIMRIADMMISFPGMVLAIAIAGLLGASMFNAVMAIAAVTWTKYARLSKSLVLKLKTGSYIEAAIVAGAKTPAMLFRHILPNIVPTMIITAATDIGGMMLELAGLSFLGFGATAPTPEWGLMLNEGRNYITKAPWLMVYPGLAIIIVVVIFNMLGDSLRDALDSAEK